MRDRISKKRGQDLHAQAAARQRLVALMRARTASLPRLPAGASDGARESKSPQPLGAAEGSTDRTSLGSQEIDGGCWPHGNG